MKALSACVRFLDAVSDWTGTIISWLTTVLVGLVCYQVFTRYALNVSRIWIDELQWHVFAALFLLGAAWTLKDDKHVRVDLIYTRFGPKGKAWVNLLGTLLFLLPFCVIVIWASVPFVESSWQIGERSTEGDGLPARYVLKACIPVAFVFLFLQGISLGLRSLLTILGREPGERAD